MQVQHGGITSPRPALPEGEEELREAPPAAPGTGTELPLGFRWGRLRVGAKQRDTRSAQCFLARDPLLKREVLLVLRHPEATAQQRHAHRLIVDAKRLTRVQHPALRVVYGAGMERQRAGYWRALDGGLTLADWVAREGALGGLALLALAQGLAGAVHALHDQLIAHGDLHPQAVLRDAAETGWLLREPGVDSWLDDVGSAPLLDGTLPYLAPERRTDPRAAPGLAADLYGLGATLLFAATGRGPQEPAAWTLLAARRELPTAFARLLRRLLVVDPLTRPDAAQVVALWRDLEAAPADLLSPRRRLQRAGWWLLAGLLTALCGLGVVLRAAG